MPVAGEEERGWPRQGGIGPLAERVGADTRAVALSSPNDPTGAPVARADVRALCERVGERVWVLLDEAFADFLEPGEDAAALVAELPNLLVFRTFAKAHAMAGFRIGYVLAPTAELAERLTPSFSVNAPAQAAAAWALELGDRVLARRRAAAARERDRLARALRGTSLSFAPSAAPFVWLSSDAHDAEAIAAHLRVRRIVGRARRALGRRAPRPHHAARRRGHRPSDLCAARIGLMARTYDEIDDHMRAWIARQPMFFVGTAPLAGDGHVNVSPKGPGGTLRVLGPRRVAYLDYSGSGAETIAHLRENGRVVVMLCAFEGPPRIVRLHGQGEFVLPDDPRFEALLEEADFEEPTLPESRRAIVVVEVSRIGSSCGYGVPADGVFGRAPAHGRLDAQARLAPRAPTRSSAYQAEHNAHSIDGLPAVVELTRRSTLLLRMSIQG